jgi:hypothetical protein
MMTNSIRVAAVAATTVAMCGASAAVAPAAGPIAGEWSGNQGATFQVKGGKVTEFRARCFPLTVTMKVKAGRFSFNRKMALEGGRGSRLRISGRFTSDVEAKGTVKYGRCSVKFTAKALNAPEPPPPPEPAPNPEDA